MNEVIAVVTDLFFQSRVNAAARAAGREVRFVAPHAAKSVTGLHVLALVDLDASPDVLVAIRDLKAGGNSVIAFGPHVDTALRKAARAAGADRVLAKSKFVTELPQIMRGPDSPLCAAKCPPKS